MRTPSTTLETVKSCGELSISLFEMLGSLSTALDLINPALEFHHKTACYIACHIAQELGYGTEDCNDLFAAAIIHDIGAITLSERIQLMEFEDRGPHLHARVGAVLASQFPPFSRFAPIIRFHHVPWKFGKGKTFNGNAVPKSSHILHLADRIAVLLDCQKPAFDQVEGIRDTVSRLAGPVFVPEFVEAFLRASRREVFWLDLNPRSIDRALGELSQLPSITIGIDELLELSRFFALIIDTRSRFTATHSIGVAASAEALARLHGLSEYECKQYRVAGHLHDIGKLSIPDTILEKDGELELAEWRIIRAHTYYTWQILSNVKGLREIARWAADHHENLKGDGYPFRHEAHELPLGSRILAVADVFTALSEDRPYRRGMQDEKIVAILKDMVTNEKLHGAVVNCLIDNYDEIQSIRQQAQASESIALTEFWNAARGIEPAGTVHQPKLMTA